jgi:putative toxin-antitoxin system antitoxin component (TIGR02293 family)
MTVRIKKTKKNWCIPEETQSRSIREMQEPAVVYGIEGSSPFALLKVHRHAGKYASINALYISVIRDGLPMRSLDAMMEVTGLNVYDMAKILDTSDRTLRRHDAETLLSREHSERLLEMARLYSRGADVFGSQEVFNEWMDSEVPALGGARPKSFLDTSLGIQLLLAELGRIEHGVFA